MCVAKTKAQISCVFILAYAKSRVSHDAAHIYSVVLTYQQSFKFLSTCVSICNHISNLP